MPASNVRFQIRPLLRPERAKRTLEFWFLAALVPLMLKKVALVFIASSAGFAGVRFALSVEADVGQRAEHLPRCFGEVLAHG